MFLDGGNQPFPALVGRLSRPALPAPVKLPAPPASSEAVRKSMKGNMKRDERSRAALEERGWTPHVIWECQLKKKTIDDTMGDLLPQLAEELGKELKGL